MPRHRVTKRGTPILVCPPPFKAAKLSAGPVLIGHPDRTTGAQSTTGHHSPSHSTRFPESTTFSHGLIPQARSSPYVRVSQTSNALLAAGEINLLRKGAS